MVLDTKCDVEALDGSAQEFPREELEHDLTDHSSDRSSPAVLHVVSECQKGDVLIQRPVEGDRATANGTTKTTTVSARENGLDNGHATNVKLPENIILPVVQPAEKLEQPVNFNNISVQPLDFSDASVQPSQNGCSVQIDEEDVCKSQVKVNGCVQPVEEDRGGVLSRHKRALKMSALGLLVVLLAVLWFFMGWGVAVVLGVAGIATYLFATGEYRWFYVMFKTSGRDTKAVIRYIQTLLVMKSFQRKNLSVSAIFQLNVAKDPSKPCLIDTTADSSDPSEHRKTEWTFGEVEELSNKIANVFRARGFRKGDAVALLMENRAEYICTWLGLSKIGVVVPLINTNLRNKALIHSFEVGKCMAIIFGSELTEAIKEISDQVDSKIALYKYSYDSACSGDVDVGALKAHCLDALLAEVPATPPTGLADPIGYSDNLVYIYTSGTTGLPKAAVINNSRFIWIAAAMHYVCGFKTEDRFYTPLPLYHTAGGCMTIGQMMIFGSTIVLRKKFSASQFFPDCQKFECTAAQYIGEMCRYVLATPAKPDDKAHKLRLIYGNGLRPQIWTEFVERFNIPYVAEFYGATEGNANIVNVDNTVGAIGFVSRILPAVYPIALIRVDENGDPIRNSKSGLCEPCKPGEPGVFVGKIVDSNPGRAFLGYVDRSASEKKVVRDVFKKGDAAFLSGDILVSDELGYLFFKDRTGDTFRWKGENVSTTEVEAIVSNVAGYRDAVVYGIEITGQEGRAGMASILDPDSTLDLQNLADGVRKQLPAYARPVIIRVLSKIDMTGTYKLKKTDLQKEGFDPSNVSDKIYFLNSKGVYEELTSETYAMINSGKIRF